MRILHVIPTIDPSSGGPIEGLRQLVPIYRQGGHEIDVASFDAPEKIHEYDFPARVFALGPGIGVFGYSRRAAPWFEANVSNYGLLFIDGVWNFNALAAYGALKRAKVPYGVYTHGMLDPYFKKRYPLKHIKKSIYWHFFLRRILRDAKAVLFTSEEEKILARQSFPRYRVSELVVPYGTFGPDCDLSAAAEEFLGKWLNLRGKRLATFMGRIHPKKGLDIVIEAFADALAGDPAWQLVVVGPNQVGLQQELEALAAGRGISDRITWTGMLKGSLKWGALAASEVFVLPSHQENFGVVIPEAMACGLPVIISDKVNIWREIKDYEAGMVCEDTIEGTKGAFTLWSGLTGKGIAGYSARSKICFREIFNHEVTSKKMLTVVEMLAETGSGHRFTHRGV